MDYEFSLASLTEIAGFSPGEYHHYLALVWIRSGELPLRIQDEETWLRTGSLSCLPALSLLGITPGTTDAIVILFPTAFLENLRIELLFCCPEQAGTLLHLQGVSMVTDAATMYLLKAMVKEYGTSDYFRDKALQSLLRLLLFTMARSCTDTRPCQLLSREDIRMVSDFTQLVHQDFRTQKSVAYYASLLCISPNYLNIKVKKITGNTASYHIQQCILREAVRIARKRGMGLKQVAYYLGYEDTTYFGKFFKKHTGHNFSRFRREMALVSPAQNKIMEDAPLQ